MPDQNAALSDRHWQVNDRVIVTCQSAYKNRIGTVIQSDKGHPLVAFDVPPVIGGHRRTSPAWFLRHEVAEAVSG